MNIDNHIAPEEMQRLLFENSDEPAAEFYGHLQDCPECQRALDETAAAPELWQKVSDFIDPSDFNSDARLSHTSRFDSHGNANSNSASQGDLAWDSPIEQMLDSPKHPEMMGRIGDYDIECEIGRGGMGVVLKAFDSNLNRPVAIKILAPYLAANGAARERFAREARAAASVFHPQRHCHPWRYQHSEDALHCDALHCGFFAAKVCRRHWPTGAKGHDSDCQANRFRIISRS